MKILKGRYFWFASVSAVLAGIFAFAPQISAFLPLPLHIDFPAAFYAAGYRLLFPLAVLFAGWRFRVKGGLIVCILVVPVIIASVTINSKLPNALIDVGDIILGFIFAVMIGKQGETKQQLEETTVKLTAQSERLKVEIAERERADEQYKLISNHTADIIYKLGIKDEKFNYVSPSAERSLGYSQPEALGLKLKELLTPESYFKQRDILTLDLRSGENSATLHLDLKHKDGRIIPFEIHAEFVYNEKGEPEEIVGVARDISERKTMEEQIIVQDRLAAIGQLTSGMAHELNNPLTGIISLSSVLIKKDLDEETKQDIGTIHEEAQRIANTIKNLLTLSRKQQQEKHVTDVNDCIRKILEMRKYEQTVNNIKVITQFEPELSAVKANGTQLEQVIFNIIINAEYSMLEAHKQRILYVTTKNEVKRIKISFKDNGIGITEENQKRVFTPFFSTKKASEGTGLSLSICLGIINEHGGRIYAESGKNNGATFVIELPVFEK
jgi:PAS domain S-box-containing protein